MKEEWKIFIRGVKGRGDEVKQALINLGGKVINNYSYGDLDSLFFINHYGEIRYAAETSEIAKIIRDNYREIKLPEKWKDGDIIYSPKFGTFAVYGYNNPTTVYCRVSKNDLVPYLTRAMKYDYRLATPQEIEQFHELLHKHNKEWDAEKKQVVDWKWKPNDNEEYYYILSDGKVRSCAWLDDEIDTSRFIIGNCFKTKEEAEAIAEKFKKLLKDKL